MKLKVKGDYGLFAKPYSKPESVSYPVITWTAAAGLVRSVYWKPEFEVLISRIDVLNPIQWQTIMVNGLNALPGKKGYTSVTVDRTQIRMMCLRNVEYIIYFEVVNADDKKKHESIFYRRLSQGKCKKALYLGTTDFKAYFGLVDGTEQPCKEVNESLLMPKDTRHAPNKKGGFSHIFEKGGKPVKCDKIYEFAHFEINEGVMLCKS